MSDSILATGTRLIQQSLAALPADKHVAAVVTVDQHGAVRAAVVTRFDAHGWGIATGAEATWTPLDPLVGDSALVFVKVER